MSSNVAVAQATTQEAVLPQRVQEALGAVGWGCEGGSARAQRKDGTMSWNAIRPLGATNWL